MGCFGSKPRGKSAKELKSSGSKSHIQQKLDYLKQLSRSFYSVNIKNYKNIETYKQKITEFQQQKFDYQIKISFYQVDELSHKMEIMEMVDSLDCNDKVSRIDIRLNSSIQLTSQLIQTIVGNYTDLSQVEVLDENDELDQGTHDLIKSMLYYLTLTRFSLQFSNGNLKHDQYGLDLIKQYNLIMNEQQHLTYLFYEHSRFRRCGYCSDTVQQVIKAANQI